MNFNLDIAIVVVFLAMNLIVGLRYGAGAKTIKDYALGGQNFSTAALVSTIVATWVGGGTFFLTIAKTYSDGLYYIIASSGVAVSLLVTAYLLVPRMSLLLGRTSIAEVMGELYGNNVRFIIALTSMICAAGAIAVQFKAFGNIFGYFLTVENHLAVIVAGCIVTTYSAFGGIRAVTFTDVLQFITFGIAMPMIGIIIWIHLFHPGFSLDIVLKDPKFNFGAVLNLSNPKFWEIIPLMLFFTVPALEPVFCQRISIGRNLDQVKKAFLIASLILIIIKLVVAWIPFLIYSVNPNIAPNSLVAYIIDNYTQPGLKGLIIIGVLALAMSTADSYINISSVLFANDLCKPLNIGVNKELLLSRSFAFLLGIGGIGLALVGTDLLQIILTANSFYMPIATGPILLTILGFRSTTFSVLTGMVAGFITVVAWKILNIEADCIVFAMVVNITFLLGSHYFFKQSGGWISAKNQKYVGSLRQNPQANIDNFVISVNKFSFIEFCRKHSPDSDESYTGLGIYCFIFTISMMYATPINLINIESTAILLIFKVMMVTSVMLATYPIWPPSIKHDIIVQIAWNIVIFYMLVVFSGYFALINKFGSLPLVVFTLNMIVVAILCGWRIATPMIIVGFCISLYLYRTLFNLEALSFDYGSVQSILVYTLFLSAVAVLMFLKPKQEHQQLTDDKVDHLSGRLDYQDGELTKALELKNEFIRNVTHEYHAPMTGIISTAETLWEMYEKLPDKMRKEAAENIYKSMIRLDHFDNNINSLAKLANPEHELKKAAVNLSNLIEERATTCMKLYINDKEQENRIFSFNIEPDVTVECDEYFITKTIDNLIINSILYCKEGKIEISLKQSASIVEFTIQDEGIGIPAKDIYDIFGAFTVSSKTRTPAGGRGVGLALCKTAISMHNGEIKAESNGIKGARFVFTLPV